MKVYVTKNTISLDKDYIVNKGEYKANLLEFEFSEEYTNDLIKKAIFVSGENAIEQAIINNQCNIPYEVLNVRKFELRVYAYVLENDELKLRYSPTFTNVFLREGSYRGNTGSGQEITPTQFEQYEQALNDGLQEVANIDIDANKSENVSTVTITNRYGQEKSVEINDGVGLEYNWQGTSLGIKREDETNYQYTNLKGDKGDQGVQGEQGIQGIQGIQGETGNGIASIQKTGTSGLVDTYTITYTNGNTTTFTVSNGKGISSIVKTGSAGLVDNYRITYNDGTYFDYTVTNGQDGYTPVKGTDYWTTSDKAEIVQSAVTQVETDIQPTITSIENTADTANSTANTAKSIAKGANQALSYGNYQTMITAFNALANDVYNVGQNVMIITLEVPDLWISSIENTSQSYTYTTDSAFTTELSTNGYVQVGYYKLSALETQKVDLTDYVTNTDYATSNKGGVIKTANGFAVSNGTPYVSSRTYNQYLNDANGFFIGKSTLENVIAGKNLETANNKVTSISNASTNTQYPSAKAVYDLFNSIVDGDEVSY